MPAATAASASARAGAPPTVNSAFSPAARGDATAFAVQPVACVAELEHLAEHGDLPRARRSFAITSSARRNAAGLEL